MAYEFTRESNLWEDECILVKTRTEIDKNGIPVEVEEPQQRAVDCRIGSLYEKEMLYAHQMGISAQWKCVISFWDYEDEQVVIYRGRKYNIYRKFISGDYIELYLRDDVGTFDGTAIRGEL